MSVVKEHLLNAAAVADISAQLNDPAWLKEFRREAFEVAEATSLPSQKDEAWRRTDVSAIELERVVPFVPGPMVVSPDGLPDGARALFKSDAANVQVQVNSTIAYRALEDRLAKQGVIFTDLVTAAREHEQLVKDHLMTTTPVNESKFTALHAAFLSGGTFLYVPKNVKIEVPLEIVLYADAERAGIFAHTLIVADEGSEVSVVERYGSADLADQALHTGIVEIIARPGSRVRYSGLQNWGSHFWSFLIRRAHILTDASVDWVAGEFGGDLARSEVTSLHKGTGANSNIYSMFFGVGSQHLDVAAAQVHDAKHSISDIVGRGVLNDRARAVWRGLGQILEGAAGSETFQRQQTLVLSDRARCDSIPGLLIDENDVSRAGHAATVGQVDREQLFYLMSRGLSRKQATRLIVDGFIMPLINRIPVEAVRDDIVALVARKIGV